MTSQPNTLALACVTAAGAARRRQMAHTVVRNETRCQFDEFSVFTSQEFAVLRENGVADHLTPLASFLPGGKMELHPAGAALPFFQTRIDSDVHQLP